MRIWPEIQVCYSENFSMPYIMWMFLFLVIHILFSGCTLVSKEMYSPSAVAFCLLTEQFHLVCLCNHHCCKDAEAGVHRGHPV